MSFVILVPVLGRAASLRPLVDSLARSTVFPWHLRFLCSPGDQVATERCIELAQSDHRITVRVVPWEAGHGDWARKINLGYSETTEPFMLLGATDLRFHPGWDREVMAVAERTGAGVIGTNDLGNALVKRGKHSTHPVVRRSYVDEHGTIDEEGKVLHEGYRHQWVDNELIATAQSRGEWACATRSHVEHLHPMWRKGEMDATYEKALSTPHHDMRLFRSRTRLWTGARSARRSLSSVPPADRAASS